MIDINEIFDILGLKFIDFQFKKEKRKFIIVNGRPYPLVYYNVLQRTFDEGLCGTVAIEDYDEVDESTFFMLIDANGNIRFDKNGYHTEKFLKDCLSNPFLHKKGKYVIEGMLRDNVQAFCDEEKWWSIKRWLPEGEKI